MTSPKEGSNDDPSEDAENNQNEGESGEGDQENNEKLDDDKNEIEPEEEEEEEEKFENAVEAKDFNYFKSQCKFEKFVNQLGSTSNRSKEQGALFSFFGSSLLSTSLGIDEEDEEETSNKPMIGFDTRFTYNREGLIVYDVNTNILIDEAENPYKGISEQDYNVFRNSTPANEIDKNMGYDYYQKFKSYRNALAPFAGLEFATDHERKIYEFLPPFKKRKVHDKFRDLRIPNTENIIFFNSEFECGNLQRAVRVSDFEYNLYLEYDKNSRNYTQWYYFSCRNVKKGRLNE